MRAGRRRAAALPVVLLLALAACRVEEAPKDSAVQAPDWTLPDLNGGSLALADLRGKPVVIDFWATWCTPCEFQIPILNRIHGQYGDRVEMVGIAVDVGGREVVAPFAAEHKISYRVVLGDEELAQRYGALGFPSLFVLRADGTIDSSHVGLIEPEDLASAIEQALRASPQLAAPQPTR